MRDRIVPHLAAALVSAVILAPVIAQPGDFRTYVLTYDMNFVPKQNLVLDLIAPVSGAPRAVPLDAAVSLANTVVPGWLLQRIVLIAIIWFAVVGAARLIPANSLFVRVIAGVAYAWTPFLAERLLLGQWGLLLTYAALPWLARAATELRQPAERHRTMANWARLVLAAGVSALTPTGGLIAAAVCLAILPVRRWATAGPLLLLLNSPWLVAALVTDSGAHSDPAGVTSFAARAENWAGPIVALLGTGGIWNAETTPASRASPLVPLLTLGLLTIAFIGYPEWRRRHPPGLAIVALGGLGLAALTTFPVGVRLVSWLVRTVPGAGLLRDAQKFALPFALLLMICVALGAQRIAQRLTAEAGQVALTGVLLLCVLAVPDLPAGGLGALRAVSYPADWDRVRERVGADPGLVLSLPLSEYRSYPWNHHRTVIDPAPRYLPAPVLIDDQLLVGQADGGQSGGGQVIEGEDPRLQAIRARLSAGEPVAGNPAAGDSIRWVLVQSETPSSALTGLELVYSGPNLSLYRDPAAQSSTPDTSRHITIIAAEIALLLALLAASMVLLIATMMARRAGW